VDGYDGLNRRIVSKTDGMQTSGSLGTTRHFYYSTGWQIIETRVDERTNAVERQYVWGLQYVDELICRDLDGNDDGDFADADETLYALQNANWDVTALAGGMPTEDDDSS
jgi:hypothetical protein